MIDGRRLWGKLIAAGGYCHAWEGDDGAVLVRVCFNRGHAPSAELRRMLWDGRAELKRVVVDDFRAWMARDFSPRRVLPSPTATAPIGRRGGVCDCHAAAGSGCARPGAPARDGAGPALLCSGGGFRANVAPDGAKRREGEAEK